MIYHLYRDAANQWRWRLQASNWRIIADSAEAYRNRDDCIAAINLVKGSASAPVKDE